MIKKGKFQDHRGKAFTNAPSLSRGCARLEWTSGLLQLMCGSYRNKARKIIDKAAVRR